MPRTKALPSLALLLIGCGGSSSSGPKTITLPDGTVVLDPAPPTGGQQLTSDPFTIQPGQERYLCWTFRSPSDAARAITAVSSIQGRVVHHVVVFRTIIDEWERVFDCPILERTSWIPIWAGGTGNPSLVTPDGVAFIVQPNTQYLLQLHLQNTTESPVSSQAGVNITYDANVSKYQPAGIFALGKFNLDIPAHQLGYSATTTCSSHRAMNVFAAFPHMHKLGKKLVFESGTSASDATMRYQIDPWVFGNQPMDRVDFQIARGDYLSSTCTWDNTTDADVQFGESSDNEMCFMILFYYPFTSLGGCVK
jgi:hypothetical protein